MLNRTAMSGAEPLFLDLLREVTDWSVLETRDHKAGVVTCVCSTIANLTMFAHPSMRFTTTALLVERFPRGPLDSFVITTHYGIKGRLDTIIECLPTTTILASDAVASTAAAPPSS